MSSWDFHNLLNWRRVEDFNNRERERARTRRGRGCRKLINEWRVYTREIKWWGGIFILSNLSADFFFQFFLCWMVCDSIHESYHAMYKNFVVAWALFWGGKRVWRRQQQQQKQKEGKIYSNFLFQHFFSCARSLARRCCCCHQFSGWGRELKYFFPDSYCWLKKAHPYISPSTAFTTSTQFHFSFQPHTLQHFFTFNVIVVVVCDSSEKKGKRERGRWNGKWELHDEMREGKEKL